MTCRIIYTIALTIIGETESAGICEDYAARSPSLLNVIFARYAKLSEIISGNAISTDDILISDLENEYPLHERLIPLCAESLAAMLITDELPDISELLNKRAVADAEAISREFTDVGQVREVYNI